MTDYHVRPAMNRRTFLKTTTQTVCGIAVASSPLRLLASTKGLQNLTFFHTHTGEEFQLCYENGTCSPLAKKQLFSFLRDFRTGEVHPIDFKLINMLSSIQEATGSKGVYEVISGYRSPQTNAHLRSSSSGVAKKSLHMQGMAIDIRLRDLPTSDLRDAARSLKSGGVGYYAKSDFVHIDTGKVRSW